MSDTWVRERLQRLATGGNVDEVVGEISRAIDQQQEQFWWDVPIETSKAIEKQRLDCEAMSDEKTFGWFIVSSEAHATDPLLRCLLCNENFNSSHELRGHEISEHAGRIRCLDCKKIFKSYMDLRRHSRATRHRIENIFKISSERNWTIAD